MSVAAALILYGSRARGDARLGSDVDLIFADDGGSIASPRHINGVSVHRYSKIWLEEEARSGSLFAYHVAFEGVALEDGDAFQARLRSLFTKKKSYSSDRRRAALVLRMLLEQDWHENSEARRRYFWALRTVLICMFADQGTPTFASVSLENLSGIVGLSRRIYLRSEASFQDFISVGGRVLKAYAPDMDAQITGARLRGVLVDMGGIAADSVRIIEEREAIEVGDALTYL